MRMENKPHCYGKMDWILKYPEGSTPKDSICDCQCTNSCLRLTRNKNAEDEAMTFKEVIKSFEPIEIVQGIVGIAIALVAVYVGYVAMWCR